MPSIRGTSFMTEYASQIHTCHLFSNHPSIDIHFRLRSCPCPILSSTPYRGDGSYLPSYLCPFTVLPISSYLHISISSHPTPHPHHTTPMSSIANKLTFRHTYLNLNWTFYWGWQHWAMLNTRSPSVFAIACWTEARDQRKQPWSSKATVYGGPKVQQSVLVFRNSYCQNIVPNISSV